MLISPIFLGNNTSAVYFCNLGSSIQSITYILMKKKLVYDAPEAELFLIQFEENFLQSGGGNQHSLTFSNNGGAGGELGYREVEGDF